MYSLKPQYFLGSHKLADYMNLTCCMARTNCRNRNSWMQIRSGKHRGHHSKPHASVNISGLSRSDHKTVHFSNILGLQVALGNVNFHEEEIDACHPLLESHLEVCP